MTTSWITNSCIPHYFLYLRPSPKWLKKKKQRSRRLKRRGSRVARRVSSIVKIGQGDLSMPFKTSEQYKTQSCTDLSTDASWNILYNTAMAQKVKYQRLNSLPISLMSEGRGKYIHLVFLWYFWSKMHFSLYITVVCIKIPRNFVLYLLDIEICIFLKVIKVKKLKYKNSSASPRNHCYWLLF